MIVADIAQEVLAVLVALFILRYAQTKISADSQTGKALAYILH